MSRTESSSGHPPVRVAVFRRIEQVDAVVHDLVEAGIAKDEISVICPTCSKERFEPYRTDAAGSHTAEAAAAGGAIGALLGGLTAAVGVAATGGVGLLVAGPIFAGLAGGGVAGGFIGAMTTRGMEHEIADFYDQHLQKGRILVAVDASGPGGPRDLERAERIFERAGAEPIELREG